MINFNIYLRRNAKFSQMRFFLSTLFFFVLLQSKAQYTLSSTTIEFSEIKIIQPSCNKNNGIIKLNSDEPNLRYYWSTPNSKGNAAFNLGSGTYSCTVKNSVGDSTLVSFELHNQGNCDEPTISDFSFNQAENGIVFFYHELSNDDDSKVFWSFGDSTPVSSQNTTIHQFTSNGSYRVCLKKENKFGVDTLYKDIEVTSVAIKGEEKASFVQILEGENSMAGSGLRASCECNNKIFSIRREADPSIGDYVNKLYIIDQVDSNYHSSKLFPNLNLASRFHGDEYPLICFNNRVYFLSEEFNQVYKYTLYSTDGTETGTTMHLDNDFGLSPERFKIIDDEMYFRTRTQMYKLNNQKQAESVNWLTSTSYLEKYGDYFAHPQDFWQKIAFQKKTNSTTINVDRANKLIGEANGYFFFTNTTQSYGTELWRTDGTQAGTQLIKDINIGAESSNIESYAFFENKLYFGANDRIKGMELWVSDGTSTGTYIVKDINSGALGSSISHLNTVGNFIYFAANDGIHGKELWKTDGTSNGTQLLKDIKLGIDSFFSSSLSIYDKGIIPFQDSLLYLIGGGNGLSVYNIANDEVTYSVSSTCEKSIFEINNSFEVNNKLIIQANGLFVPSISQTPQIFSDIRYLGDTVTVADSLSRKIRIVSGEAGYYSFCSLPMVDSLNYVQNQFSRIHSLYAIDESGFSDKVIYKSFTYPIADILAISNAVKCSNNQVYISLKTAIDSKNFVENDLVVSLSINNGAFNDLQTLQQDNYTLKADMPAYNETDILKFKVKSLSRRLETQEYLGMNKNQIEVFAVTGVESGTQSKIGILNHSGLYPYSLSINNQLFSGILDELFQYNIAPSETQTYTVSSFTNSCGVGEIVSAINKIVVCKSALSHNGSVSGEHNSKTTINSSASLTGKTVYNAGNSIVLTPGFNVTGAVGFSANVKICGQ